MMNKTNSKVTKNCLIVSLILFFMNISALAAFCMPASFHLKAEASIYRNSQNEKIRLETWFANNKTRVEMKGKASAKAGGMGSSIIITDINSKTTYLLDPVGKTGVKIDLNKFNKKQSMSISLNDYVTKPENVEKELKKKGGKKVGSESLLGNNCDIWQLDAPKDEMIDKAGWKNVTMKMWFAKDLGMILKVETKSSAKGMIMEFKVTEFQKNASINSAMFSVPKEYKIAPLAPQKNKKLPK